MLGSEFRPLSVAIIGSGPSGFYAAETLLGSKIKVVVDVFDRLPAPFGLVRYGVAPDHPKIKNVIKVYEKIAANSGFRFFGNIKIGNDVKVSELRQFYDAIIFACGAETDKKLGIPGENLPGSYTATEFVGWYNGHPDYRTRSFDLSGEVAVIVGQGNVAMDVARILCKTVEELKNTDMTQYALDALSKSNIKEVHLVGRRGPVQAAFTPVEIREFGELADCAPVIDPKYFEINEASKIELDDQKNALRRKNWEILQKLSQLGNQTKKKKFVLHFLKSPVELKGSSRLEEIILEKNELFGEANQQKARGMNIKEALKCGIFFRSVGYYGVPIPEVPFDEKKGNIPNLLGRVLEGGKTISGLYATGWIKRGPSGVIGTNKADSDETVAQLLSDINKLAPADKPQRDAIENFFKARQIRYVTYEDWKKIDLAEIEKGKLQGKPREKITAIEEMLALAGI